MSAVGEARQRPAVPVRAATWRHGAVRGLGGTVRGLFGIFLVLAGLALVGASALAWRLSHGPLDVSWLANRIATWALPSESPARLTIAHASIAWNGFVGGDRALLVRLQDVNLKEASGASAARVDLADVSVSLPRLLNGQVAPRLMLLDGVRLRAVRTAQGAVNLDLGGLADTNGDGGASLGEVLTELRQPAKTDRGIVTPGLETLSQLQRVRVRDATLTVFDAATGTTVLGEIATADLQRQGGGGVQGEASGTLAVGPAKAALTVTAGLLTDGGTHVEARLAPLPAAAVAQSSPALALIGALDGAVAAHASLDLNADLRPRAGTLAASTGSATIATHGGSVRFDRLSLDASATWSGGSFVPDRIELRQAQAVVPSPRGGWSSTIGASGGASRHEGRIAGQFDLTLDHAAFADLPLLWPAAWGGHVRPWLTENVTAGTVRDGAFHIVLEAPEAQLADTHILDAGGTLEGEDVTIHWIRPVQPIEHARAHLIVVNADVLDIVVPSATQGPIALRDGFLHFTGLAGKDQFLSMTSQVQGKVSDLLALLREPRLALLDKHPLPISSSAGTLAGTLALQLPMKDHLEFDDVLIQAKGRLDRLHLGGTVAGHDIDRGDIQFDVNQNELHASGPAQVGGIPSAVTVGMDFRSGPPTEVAQRATMVGRASAAQLAAAGLDTGGVVTAGTLGIQASYETRRDGSGQVTARADLTQAGLAFAGWRKPPGAVATAAATLLLEHDELSGIRDIEASGPGLQVVARSAMVNGRPLLLDLDRVVLGPTQASGQLRFPARPGETLQVRLAGPVLDLSSQLASGLQHGSGQSQPIVADIRFDRVILGEGASLLGVAMHADWDGKRLRQLQASSTGPEQLRAVVQPDGTGRRVSARLEQAGDLLRALGALDTLHGGKLALEARYDDRYPEPPLQGTLDVSEFGVRDAVVLGKLLQAVTVYGIVDALKREGVYFKRLIMPFTLDRTVLQIGETRAFSASLGLTAQGWIDFGRHNINLHGTIVPAYAVNAALGRIPVVGRLFSPEAGGGLVAVNYSVTGKSTDPAVGVNPLSALTPGFLRQIFSVFN